MNENNKDKNPHFIQNLLSEDSDEFLQLITADDEMDVLKEEDIPQPTPVLPIKNTVLFPGVVLPITVSRKKSVRLVKEAYKNSRIISVFSQKNDADEPEFDDIYTTGTVARILKMLVLPDGNTTIIIQGKNRATIDRPVNSEPYLTAKISLIEDHFPDETDSDMQLLINSLKEAAQKILKLNPEIPQEAKLALENIDSPVFLTHFLSSNLNTEVAEKQRLLEINDGKKRSSLLLELMLKDIKMLEVRNEIQKKVYSDIDQQQRDYFLRQQMKVLQDELGQDSPDKDIEHLQRRGNEKKWPERVAKFFQKEVDKLKRMNPMAAEYPVTMNFVEFLVDMPWEEYTRDNFDLRKAQKILDKDHYGLERVKERILEYLAVLKLKNDMRGPILCLYGPPGVGKTSLGKSIATALGRKYVRMSLGGVHDEAEIRGHRKTYVGAMPGKIIQYIKKVGSSNPIFVLDEIDKVSSDFRGDPSSALLEVLDPEQNNTFTDNYLEVDYDLSKVLFVATANSLDTIQPALRDRMEIIEINGYTMEEKVQIANKHLIPKQLKEHGLTKDQVKFPKKTVESLIQQYTRESGVRSLEREIGRVIRRVAKFIAMEEDYEPKISQEVLHEILGAPVFNKDEYSDIKTAGVATGLAWTQSGGDVLFIESGLYRGKGKLTLSGQLGDVMKESAMTALSYLKTHAEELNIHHSIFNNYDLHVHVPAGAVPKDGPSAGITMLTSLASAFTQRMVKKRLAMTGEITLRGKVLPVGGIKEKLLAAKRFGIKDLIMCSDNKKDVAEIDQKYLKGLTIHYVDNAGQVLDIALEHKKVNAPLKFHIEEN